MKRCALLAGLALALFPVLVSAQGTLNDLEQDFGGRVSLTLDKKLAKGIHLALDGEARVTDRFRDFGRYQAGIGMTYKFNPTFKAGAGYQFIDKKTGSTLTWKPRHRFYLDGSATFRAGEWRLSLKERLQLTHRNVNNPYQDCPNSLALKSRFKAAYKGLPDWTPYAYVELRNVFNDPRCSASWNTATRQYSDYEFLGYSDAYANRLRASLGAEWKINKQNVLDFFVLTDYCKDKDIDTNARGTTLKSLTWDQAFRLNLGVGYTFSF